jgi:hypothetical protein
MARASIDLIDLACLLRSMALRVRIYFFRRAVKRDRRRDDQVTSGECPLLAQSGHEVGRIPAAQSNCDGTLPIQYPASPIFPGGMSAREKKMRVLVSLVALLGLLSSAANAGPKEDARAVLDKWTKAFAASDVDGIVKLYAPGALFVGTSSKAVVVKPEDRRAGMRGL